MALSPAYSKSTIVKVAIAASVGGWVEWYDFLVAGIAAAVVWHTIFFPSGNPTVATALSIGAYGAIYAGRPIGAYLFGHLGDRLGRRNTLVFSLLAVGIGALGLTILPTYSVIGLLAPALIILLRIVEGIGIGGDFGTSNTWISEFVPKSKWRGFWTSWVQTGPPVGIAASSIGFAVTSKLMSHTDFIDVGWRYLFLIGVVAVIIGGIIRLSLLESPLFKNLEQTHTKEKYPASRVLRSYWKPILLFTLAMNTLLTVYSGVINPYSVGYMTAKGLSVTFTSTAIAIAASFAIIMVIVGGIMGDRWGRRRTMILYTVLFLIGTVIYFPVINTLNQVGIVLNLMLLLGSAYMGFGTFGAFAVEHFPTNLRASGTGYCLNLGAIIAAVAIVGIIPAIITKYGGTVPAWPGVLAVGLVIDVLALIAAILLKEPKVPDLAEVRGQPVGKLASS